MVPDNTNSSCDVVRMTLCVPGYQMWSDCSMHSMNNDYLPKLEDAIKGIFACAYRFQSHSSYIIYLLYPITLIVINVLITFL